LMNRMRYPSLNELVERILRDEQVAPPAIDPA
jgi:hypothetical protein